MFCLPKSEGMEFFVIHLETEHHEGVRMISLSLCLSLSLTSSGDVGSDGESGCCAPFAVGVLSGLSVLLYLCHLSHLNAGGMRCGGSVAGISSPAPVR